MAPRVNASLRPSCLTALILALVLPEMPDRPEASQEEEGPGIALA